MVTSTCVLLSPISHVKANIAFVNAESGTFTAVEEEQTGSQLRKLSRYVHDLASSHPYAYAGLWRRNRHELQLGLPMGSFPG